MDHAGVSRALSRAALRRWHHLPDQPAQAPPHTTGLVAGDIIRDMHTPCPADTRTTMRRDMAKPNLDRHAPLPRRHEQRLRSRRPGRERTQPATPGAGGPGD
jgi:hypothetical protein